MTTKVYEGTSTSSSHQIYAVDKGKIYKGSSTSSSNEISNIKPSGIKIDGGKVYKGNPTSSSNQIMNVDGKLRFFKGTSTSSSNQLASLDGDRLSDAEFEKIVYLLAQRNNLL